MSDLCNVMQAESNFSLWAYFSRIHAHLYTPMETTAGVFDVFDSCRLSTCKELNLVDALTDTTCPVCLVTTMRYYLATRLCSFLFNPPLTVKKKQKSSPISEGLFGASARCPPSDACSPALHCAWCGRPRRRTPPSVSSVQRRREH